MSQSSERYSKALFDLAQEKMSLEELHQSMSGIGKFIQESADFRRFLGNPLLSYDQKSSLLKALFEKKVPDLFLQFLLFIAYKGRLSGLADMIESFDALYLQSTRQLKALITTAQVTEDTEKTYIGQCLNDKFKAHVLPQWTIDKSLIGGFKILVKDKMYDYSFRNQLENYLQKTIQPV
ncbi:MAG: ATP synthase F1 subunit delta [Candidatus Omnitrophica bacterium]|nr:ATP synthase F1 subunit delta [Candidatus Omnitrophota bacterium]